MYTDDVEDVDVPPFDPRDLGKAVLLKAPQPLCSHHSHVVWTRMPLARHVTATGISTRPVEAVIEVGVPCFLKPALENVIGWMRCLCVGGCRPPARLAPSPAGTAGGLLGRWVH